MEDIVIDRLAGDRVLAWLGQASGRAWNRGLHEADVVNRSDPQGFSTVSCHGEMVGCTSEDKEMIDSDILSPLISGFPVDEVIRDAPTPNQKAVSLTIDFGKFGGFSIINTYYQRIPFMDIGCFFGIISVGRG
jgi:hypothetical protein